MKYQFLVICIYLFMTICSMANIKDKSTDMVKLKETDHKKDTDSAKKIVKTDKIADSIIDKAKIKSDVKENVEKKDKIGSKDVKEITKTKENKEIKTTSDKEKSKDNKYENEKTKAKENKDTMNKPKYFKRKSYATKEDIPKDYLEYLKKRYNILEDPLGEYERKQAEYEFYDDYDYDNDYERNLVYDDYLDKNEEQKEQSESGKIDQNLENNNETEGNCTGCTQRESDKELRIATIKSTILGKIGFSNDNFPNMTGKTIPKIPSIERLIAQHEMQSDAPYQDYDEYLPEDEYYGQVKRAYSIAQEPPEDLNIHIPDGCYFELTEAVTTRKIRDASLWIYLEPSSFKRKSVVEIYVYVVPQKAKPQHILKGPVRYEKTSKSGWIEFKFAHIVHHWIKQPTANRGIIIHALDEDGNNHVVTPGKHSNENFIPMLEMSTVEHQDDHSRRKRSISNICTDKIRIESCCRYPLRVDFVQFGWDWVIAPTGYEANYCSGECGYRHMENSPQAYLIQQTPNATATSGPCCTPSKFYPLAMLYFDHHHTVLYTHMQKMIVVRCNCA